MAQRLPENAVLMDDPVFRFALPHLERKGHLRMRMWDRGTALQTVLDGISDPVLILNGGFSVKKLNRAAAAYYGLHETQKVIGRRCYQALRGRAEPCEECPYPSVILTGHGGTFERKGMMDPCKFEQVVLHPIEIGILIWIRDITKAKVMERQVIQSQRLASLGLLVSGIVHEIRNLNNCITFNIPILAEYLMKLVPIIDDYARRHQDFELFGMSYAEFRKDIFNLLGNLEHASNRISTTVSGLREFAGRSGRGERRWIDLRQVIDGGVAICRCQIEKMVNSFDVNIAEDLPVIFTDPEALEQVLVNLLINAAQATEKEDSWVSLRVDWDNTQRGQVIIEVRDNGCGMNEETRAKVFEPFFTTKPPGKGTGLGLFVSRNLIEELGGRIEVESKPDYGSTFRVILCKGEVRPKKSAP